MDEFEKLKELNKYPTRMEIIPTRPVNIVVKNDSGGHVSKFSLKYDEDGDAWKQGPFIDDESIQVVEVELEK